MRRRRLARHQVPRLAALALLLAIYLPAREPGLSAAARGEIGGRFRFTRAELAGPQNGAEPRSVRRVHARLAHISAWISAVGAAVALADVDGDGLANDVCQVETRTDQVVVAPAPTTEPRYPPFTLEPDGLPYDGRQMAPMGCLPGDLNEDGWVDLLVTYWGRTPIAFLRLAPAAAVGPMRPAAASFLAREVASRPERWYTNAATRADVDGDGHVDLLVGNYFPDGSSILGEGEGEPRMQESMSRARNGGCNRLLLWREGVGGERPRVRFEEAPGALEPTGACGWTLAVGAADLDGDLLPEIYFANDFGSDRLLHNRSRAGAPRFAPLVGRRGFLTPVSKVLGRDSFKGMGVDFADLNGDGLLDLFVSNIAQAYALEESHFLFVSTGRPQVMRAGIAPYRDASERLGLARSAWAWESRLADFDNDGTPEALQAAGFVRGKENRWPELHELAMGNDALLSNPASWPRFQPGDGLSGEVHNPFFVRVGDRYFDLAVEAGLGEAHISRGIAVADVDGDGDLDFALANQWEPSVLYRNELGSRRRSLQLDLLLPVAAGGPGEPRLHAGPPPPGLAARSAVGATAKVHLPGGGTLTAQVDGGSGHSGERSPELHFGLGELPAEPLAVDLTWRDPRGRPSAWRLHLPPGRHTVLLPWNLEKRE